MATLSELYFGKDAAEADAAPAGLLDESFVRTEGYELALLGQKSLFIGRKGTGKSAICIKIHQELSAMRGACIVTPDEISAEEIRKFDLIGITPVHAKRLLWRYVFTVAVAKHALHRQRESPLIAKAPVFDKIRTFLVDNDEVDDLSLSERLWRVIQRLKMSLKVSALGAGLHLEASGDKTPAGLRLSSQIDLFVARVKEAADLVFSSSQPFIILVDQVERVWAGDQNSQLMVQGLLAAKDLGLGTAVRVVYFLRTDIYQAIRFHEGDKYHSDEFRLSWSKGRLVRLIEERAHASVSRARARGVSLPVRSTRPASTEENTDALPNDGVDQAEQTPPRGTRISWWSNVWEAFPNAIDDVPIDEFLVDHTLYRPRDIIQLCNACRDTALSNRHEVVTKSDVRHALTIYSQWKISDLVSEWGTNYPYLNDLLLVFANSSYLLTRARLDARLASVLPDLAQRYPTRTNELVSDLVIDALFGIGFLGVLRAGLVRYSYDEQTPISPQDVGFYIHPCYRIGLRASSAIELAPYSANASRVLAGHGFSGRLLSDTSTSQRIEQLLLRVRNALGASHLPYDCKTEIVRGLDEAVQDLRNTQSGVLALEGVLLQIRLYVKGVQDRLMEGSWLETPGDRFRSVDVAAGLESLRAALEVVAS